jgi:transcriptional regulator with XRE-family HTH domain
MRRRGLGLRELCREAGLDPSFFSKVLSGKRNPPAEALSLRRLAGVLGVDAPRLFVAAGRIPSEWWRIGDPDAFDQVHAFLTGRAEGKLPVSRPRSSPPRAPGKHPLEERPARGGLEEELL